MQERLWLHHGASATSSVATAIAYARFHIETRGWLDIGYSWLVADGLVLEGRGLGRAGAHTQGQNSSSYGICMVGSYESRPPSAGDLNALVWLLKHGVDQGWWRTPQLTGGHRDAPGASTSCPGNRLHALIPHINRQAAGQPAPEPEPKPEPTWLEDIMAAGEQQLADIAAALDRDAQARERQAVATRALAAVEAARHAAQVRAHYQLDSDPHSDGIHGDRVAAGAATLADVGTALRDAKDGA